MLKPFIKWAGGKGQLLSQLQPYYLDGLKDKFTKYAEPFVGGGAVLFDILNHCKVKEVYISDINAELINTYQVIQQDVYSLISTLEPMQRDFLQSDASDRKTIYYEKRTEYNSLTLTDKINIQKAALFIFLNRTCFNGLYRVNKKGGFNVPMGSYKNPQIYTESQLLEIANALQTVEIVCADYRRSANFVDENTLVYFDPPYRPLTETANFTSYTEKPFDDAAQIELANFMTAMSQRGAKVLLSNSDPKNANENDEFFDKLYSAHTIARVEASRMINCDATSRGKITELLIANF